MIIKSFVLYLSLKTKQLRNQFHSAPENGLKLKTGPQANYVGFELNREKTEKPTSLNICCSRASQLVTKNPPDRVVMSLSEWGFRDGKCKILFGSLKMDNFPQTEDEIRLQDLKSMTLER